MKRTITVISLNVFGAPFHPKRIIRSFMRNHVRRRFKIIAQELIKEDADIVTLQEVFFYPHYFYLKNQLINHYPFVGYQRMLFGPRGGLVTFSKTPLDKVEYIDFYDRGNYTNKAITGQLTRKGILLSKLRGASIWVLNTHLIQNSDYPWREDNKFADLTHSQLDQTSGVVQGLGKTGNDVILTGDFNVPKRSIILKQFIKDTKVTDTFEEFDGPTYHVSFLPENAKAERLDFIFYYSAQKNISFSHSRQILEKPVIIENKEIYLTDHIGLITTLSFK